jgi:hypothetical protein
MSKAEVPIGTVVTEEGVRYRRISGDEAFRIRCDIQLYSPGIIMGMVRDQWDPKKFLDVACEEGQYSTEGYKAINREDHIMWEKINWFVKIDDEKPEYDG